MGLFSQLTSALNNVNTSAGRLKISRLVSDAIEGEYVQSIVAPGPNQVNLSNGIAANITSISLTAGDWDVEGMVTLIYALATQSSDGVVGISTTSATLPTDGSQAYDPLRATTASNNTSITLPRKRISVAATTTVYLVARAGFSAGTAAGAGLINARRVR